MTDFLDRIISIKYVIIFYVSIFLLGFGALTNELEMFLYSLVGLSFFYYILVFAHLLRKAIRDWQWWYLLWFLFWLILLLIAGIGHFIFALIYTIVTTPSASSEESSKEKKSRPL